jgi:hypothetical protein
MLAAYSSGVLAIGSPPSATIRFAISSDSISRRLALAHKTKELGTRAALLEFAYEFRTVAKRLERDERAASPIHGECAPR